MKKSVTVKARMDSELKESVEKILNEMGLTPSNAIKIFYSKIIQLKAIPFELNLNIEKESE
jgi:addiction module RelB/DinJ family antitoxin